MRFVRQAVQELEICLPALKEISPEAAECRKFQIHNPETKLCPGATRAGLLR